MFVSEPPPFPSIFVRTPSKILNLNWRSRQARALDGCNPHPTKQQQRQQQQQQYSQYQKNKLTYNNKASDP